MKRPLLEEKIVEVLSEGTWNRIKLRNEVVGKHLTYQAFYKAFGRLKKIGIVEVRGPIVGLATAWIENEKRRVERICRNYRLPI